MTKNGDQTDGAAPRPGRRKKPADPFGLDRLPEREITREMFLEQWAPRFGRTNPERADIPLWLELMREFRPQFRIVRALFGTDRPEGVEPDPLPETILRARGRFRRSPSRPYPAFHPGWTFFRYGRSVTELPDGRLVLIAGEHEDWYDTEFYIYADVTVVTPDGEGQPQVAHYIYPEADFPPTDFHTATLIDEAIWLIGGLGYSDPRRFGETQVLRLDLKDFSIHRVAVPGRRPGWINRHQATLHEGRIIICGGKIHRDPKRYEDFKEVWAFDPAAPRWERIN